ncbi:hypothetical protein KER56_08180 [Escherichia coli]|nr:hypothetical protein [Escherichia coli]
MEACWPGKSVSPVSLPVAIKHIRDAFKRHTSDEVILTHKGRGYSINNSLVKIRLLQLGQPVGQEGRSQPREFFNEVNIRNIMLGIVVMGGVCAFIFASGGMHLSKINKNGVTYITDFPLPKNFKTEGGEGDIIYISHLKTTIHCAKNNTKCIYED